MTINDTDETTQCAAFSSETAFLQAVAAQIEEGRALADEADDAEGGIRGSMQLMALMAQQSMTHLEASRMLSQALYQRLAETETRVGGLMLVNFSVLAVPGEHLAESGTSSLVCRTSSSRTAAEARMGT